MRPHQNIFDPKRLEVVRAAILASSPARDELDALTRAAAEALQVPVSLVSLVDADRQCFLGCHGLEEPWTSRRVTPLSHSFCQHAVAAESPLIIDDSSSDERVKDNLAIRDLGAVAYAGVPLKLPSGYVVGSFCVIDSKPRSWTQGELHLLKCFAELAVFILHGQLEREKRQSREMLLALFFDSVPAAVAMLDQEMNYLAHSRRWISDFRLQEESLVGRNHYEVFPEIPERWRVILDRCMAGSVERSDGDVFYRSDGTVDWVRWEVRPWLDSAGEIGGIVLFAENITERKRLEEQFFQAQKMEVVGRLAGGVAHDFNNILTGIGGFSQLLLARLDPKSQEYQDLQEIYALSERAAGLTRQLLAFSRKEAIERRPINLNPLIENAGKMLRRLLGEDVRLEFRGAPDLGITHADKGQVEQVLLNLAVNARDAMPEGGRLLIETANGHFDEDFVRSGGKSAAGGYVVLSVSDNGCGMDAETLKKIFDPFFTTKGEGKGTGLGLSTVYGIVQQHVGHVWVESAPGKGTTFKIYWPRVQDVEGDAEVPEVQEVPEGLETILVVEDERTVLALIQRALKGLGYRVYGTDSQERAQELFDRNADAIDLLLTDVIMPGLSGVDLYERFLEKKPDLKVLYMSGYTEAARARGRILDSSSPFLQKPFGPSDLGRKVREVLDGA